MGDARVRGLWLGYPHQARNADGLGGDEVIKDGRGIWVAVSGVCRRSRHAWATIVVLRFGWFRRGLTPIPRRLATLNFGVGSRLGMKTVIHMFTSDLQQWSSTSNRTRNSFAPDQPRAKTSESDC